TDRATFDQAMLDVLERWRPDLIVLAGFMRILTEDFVSHYQGRMLNIHPSLLPRYPGLNTHARAISAGDTEHGCTVHFVTSELDGGPPALQARVPVKPDDTPEQLAQRVQRKEHQIYPAAVEWFAQGRLTMQGPNAYMDDNRISETGLDWDACSSL
ncbi:MAG: phosphoribosylglycinamide formyltransferase, partial [Natronospirillum sp.]|uniref:phosphoribosylglycinamide formyltransferase n=1 Tax=Natronospirillum sp. TaxID=2812955 RepID=UPI0025E1427A